MLLHTDVLSAQHIINTAHHWGCNLEKIEKSGSRKRKRKFNVKFNQLPGNPARATWNQLPGNPARATWNQVGCILADLFAIDMEMFVGSGSISQGTIFYDGYSDFHDKTNSHFMSRISPNAEINPFNPKSCKRHKWVNVSREWGVDAAMSCQKCYIYFFPFGTEVKLRNAL